jgi:hypothetical protein
MVMDMIETIIALIMMLKGEVVEHTYKEKLSDCLKSKRIAEREVNPQSVRFMCKQVKAETEIYMGAKKIVKIIGMSK